MKRKLVFEVIIVILIITIIVCFFFITNKTIKEHQMNKELKEINIVKTNIINIESNNKYKLLRKEYNNRDILGSLIIKELNINVLLLQTNNNYYYLNHLPNKKDSSLGSVFIDYRTNLENDIRINIYGHTSSRYDLDFNKLKLLLNKKTFNNTKYLYIETEEDLFKYKIFLVKVLSNDSEHMKVSFTNQNSYISHLNKLKSKAYYIRDINISNDQVLIIQTCLLNNAHGDYLIIGARKEK